MPEQLISIAEARSLVLAATPRLDAERVALPRALGRVLSATLRARSDIPPFDSSAMDGYALSPGPAGRSLRVVGESRAGAPAAASARELDGVAIRISTGAAVPAGAGAVIRQEDVELEGERVRTDAAVSAGANIRRAGEDMRRGEAVLEAGVRLGAIELGAAAAAGAGELAVSRRPRVAVLCTGDELREPGEPLGAGEIHNSNAPMLSALAAGCGAEVVRVDRVGDDRDGTEAAIAAALEAADALVACGGVSVGPHDHVKPALAALGVEQRFWRVALQPGKPTWFGVRGQRLVFALPGNPVSAAVTFSLFVRPALWALQGRTVRAPETARLGTPVPRSGQREQAVRVRLERGAAGVVAHPTGPQGSHLLGSLLAADALALIPPGPGEEPRGGEVLIEPAPGREECGE